MCIKRFDTFHSVGLITRHKVIKLLYVYVSLINHHTPEFTQSLKFAHISSRYLVVVCSSETCFTCGRKFLKSYQPVQAFIVLNSFLSNSLSLARFSVFECFFCYVLSFFLENRYPEKNSF